MPIERWKQVSNFPAYEVSNRGRIKRGSKLIKSQLHDGYLYVHLSREGKRRRVSVSRLVAAAFLPNPLLLPEVNHKNGNKQDNYVRNLSWITAEGNRKHALQTGLIHKGMRKRVREITLQVVLRFSSDRVQVIQK
jgi:hypothetical protein